ncbi:MAG: SsrA-binding protein SmpB [Candidatus Margulisiibacteriota bacterium]|jgi:SsrA-binding protein|nr:SsrA-binding protein SmpB [Candidatus Margulisiibacteriota bacterium]
MAISNKKAYFNYAIKETFEAGIELVGCEVKSIRNGHMTIHESYVKLINGEVFLINANILPYEQGNRHNHKQNRDRKLLLHRREIIKISQGIERDGLVAVPTKVYLKKNRFKLEIGLGSSKKKYDKRSDIKDRELKRSLDRSFKNRQL